MCTPGFFTSWGGAMNFYDNPANAFYSTRYKRDGFQNGYNAARTKAQAIIAGAKDAVAMEDGGELCLSSIGRRFCRVVVVVIVSC